MAAEVDRCLGAPRSPWRQLSPLRLVLAPPPAAEPSHDLIINEIHYHPDSECEEEEFIELVHRGQTSIDIGGWSFGDGIGFEFPENTLIEPGDHVVVAREPASLTARFGAIAKLHGPWTSRNAAGDLSNRGETLSLKDEQGRLVDSVAYDDEAPWPISADGEGASLELLREDLNNDDPGAWGAGRTGPSPGRANHVSRNDLPPVVRAPTHEPTQPRSSNPVAIRARVDSQDGIPVVEAVVEYQLVFPGRYIRLTDPAYQESWTSVSMNRDGERGHWIATIPPQPHRTLVRYRVRATDEREGIGQAPRRDDPVPNLAYYVYDGVPDYVVDRRPHSPTDYVHEAQELTKLPVYQLLADADDMRECWYEVIPGGNVEQRKTYHWRGTFVAGGKVYDHVAYRLRGGRFRYEYSKRYMKIRFPRGHYFAGQHGEKRPVLNLNSAIANPIAKSKVRGESGIYETLAFSLFRWIGVPAPRTRWVHFRIVQHADEQGPDHYSGDFYGLYLDVEQMDKRFLRANDRSARGNLYKIDSRSLNGRWEKETNNCSPRDDADISEFVDGYEQAERSAKWWKTRLDLDAYYTYRAGIEITRHYDTGDKKNYFYYLNPATGQWEVFPWDVDMTFNVREGPGREPFLFRVLDRFPDTFGRDYRSRLRDLLDLFYLEERLFPIIDHWQELIAPMASADRDRWDQGDHAPLEQRVVELKAWLRLRRRELQASLANEPLPERPSITFPASGNVLSPQELFFTSSRFRGEGEAVHRATRWIATKIPALTEDLISHQEELIDEEALWRYHRAPERKPSQKSWTDRDYDDGDWPEGRAGFGYGDRDDATVLDDLRGAYTSVYLRRRFQVTDPEIYSALDLEVDYDDGFVAYLNGRPILRVNVPATGPLLENALASSAHERNGGERFPLGADALALLRPGENLLAIRGLNHESVGRDFSLKPRLWATVGPREERVPLRLENGLVANELFPDWDSGRVRRRLMLIRIDNDTFDTTPGTLHRIRVRYEDSEGRWSRWSEPVEIEIK